MIIDTQSFSEQPDSQLSGTLAQACAAPVMSEVRGGPAQSESLV